MNLDIPIAKIIEYLIVAGLGSIFAYFQKMRRDITAAHRKIRKIQKHLELDENGEDYNGHS